eukprot:CAMPEP_0197116872 /NCGR_PEP_ID=MMETSP1390-20130617/416_1 /TAXON_ID=38833 /ORGANISM="Micromonas sp., Strain CCMP2099" /LENGTH=64 /DNA_ID=CAMNT_0042558113 /DNA_START=127 /DNA_END=317 /DNA_ORIENTATION=+
MSGPTRTTAASSAARASAPGISPSVANAHAAFAAAWGFMSGPTRTTAASSAARASAPGISPSVA